MRTSSFDMRLNSVLHNNEWLPPENVTASFEVVT